MNTREEIKKINFASLDNVKVENMTSNSGREIPNQFLIRTDKGIYFQSYQSIIAFKPKEGGKIILGTYWAYSVTTGKYRNDFLYEDRKETQKKIDNGDYLINPNW